MNVYIVYIVNTVCACVLVCACICVWYVCTCVCACVRVYSQHSGGQSIQIHDTCQQLVFSVRKSFFEEKNKLSPELRSKRNICMMLLTASPQWGGWGNQIAELHGASKRGSHGDQERVRNSMISDGASKRERQTDKCLGLRGSPNTNLGKRMGELRSAWEDREAS